MSFAFTVTLNDPNNFSQDASLLQVVRAAATYWGRYLDGAGVIDVQVNVANLSNGDLFATHATGGPGTWTTGGTDAGRTVLALAGPVSELITGTDPNGSAADVVITVDSTFLTSGMYLNPDISHST